MIVKQYQLKFLKVPIKHDEEKQIRKIAEEQYLPYVLAKEKFFEKKTTLDKWMR
jgi:tRNA U34 2-thiouridine synthase MnmA/TrmU